MRREPAHIAIFIPKLTGGGAERIMIKLAKAFSEEGHRVDFVVCKAEGAFQGDIPNGVRLVELGVQRTLASLPSLVRYLRKERPVAMLSALNHANVVAIWAKKLAKIPLRLIVSERTNPAQFAATAKSFKKKITPFLIQKFYPWADHILGNSQGVVDALLEITKLPQHRVKVVYNPVVTKDLLAEMKEPVDHEWLTSGGQPPVILGVGSLTPQKDFSTLLRAFAKVRGKREARLMILGEGEEREKLEMLIQELGIEGDVALPGFAKNPYAYMAQANIFVLSSIREGFPNVLAEAMACGTPVVSTDCPSGPREILEGGKYGPLVPLRDAEQLGEEILKVLEKKRDRETLQKQVQQFAIDQVLDQYLQLLLD